MMLLRRRLLVVGVCLAVAVTGCNGDDPEPQPTADLSATLDVPTEATPSATPTPTPSATPTPTAAAVPDDLTTVTDDGEVTIAEAQAIIDIQTEIYNAAIIDLLTRPEEVQGGVDVSFNDELARVYVGTPLAQYSQLWGDIAMEDFRTFDTQSPTGVEDVVVEVTDTRPECVAMRITKDQSGIVEEDSESSVTDFWVRLLQVDRLSTNASGWHRATETRSEPTNPVCDREVP